MNFFLKTFLVFYSALVYTLQIPYTFLCVILFLVVSLTKSKALIRFVLFIWGHGLFFLMGKRLHVYGKENIKKNSKYLILANHSSRYDIPAIMAVFTHVSWLGREHLARIPIFGHALRVLGYIPVNRNSAQGARRIISSSIKHADNIAVAIFPEGTRTLDGKIHEFKRGFIMVTNAVEIDVVPVTLNGMFKLKPKPGFIINPFVKLEVIIHEPLHNGTLRNMSNEEILHSVKAKIESAYQH